MYTCMVDSLANAGFDEKHLGTGFMKPEPWTRIVYTSLTRERDAAKKAGDDGGPETDR